MAQSLKHKKQLPDNFASTVMDLELEVETGKFSSDSVNKLTTLYMEAVEYYAAFESEKYHYFQEKLTKLLSNNRVHEQLEQEPIKEKKTVPDKPERTEGGPNLKFNARKQMELNVIMGEKKAQDLTNSILKNYSSQSNLNVLVQNNLKTQESEFAKRLEKRKLNKSASQRSIGMSNNLSTLSPEAKGKDSGAKMPLTPSAHPTDDPYGLFSQGKAQKKTEDDKSQASPTEKKSEPTKKGSKAANFFNKLKKSGVRDAGLTTTKPEEVESPVKPFDIGNENISSPDNPVMESPESTKLNKEVQESDSPVKIDFNIQLSKKKPSSKKSKIVIKVNFEEEINALKEELELYEMQLAEEENEEAKADWEREIERVKIAIEAKEAEKKAEDENQTNNDEADKQEENPEKDTDIQQSSTQIHPFTTTSETDTVETQGERTTAPNLSQSNLESPTKTDITHTEDQTGNQDTASPASHKKKDPIGSMLNRLKNKSKK